MNDSKSLSRREALGLLGVAPLAGLVACRAEEDAHAGTSAAPGAAAGMRPAGGNLNAPPAPRDATPGRASASGASGEPTGGPGGAEATGTEPRRAAAPPGGPLPAIFLAHGAPPLLDDPGWMGELHAWANALPRPTAVLMLSAHWDESPARIGATAPVPLVYDFYGFPKRFYEMKYAAPGAPELAARVRALLAERGQRTAEEPTRGLDHGAYVPMMAMYPKADVPVLQVSLPGLDPRTVLAFGQALAPLRAEGVLVVGSGFITHNMRGPFSGHTPSWASEFDQWTAEALKRLDVDALVDFLARGPGARIALPTTEHFVPLLAALGAALPAKGTPSPAVTFPITGFWNGGGFTRRSVQLG